MHPHRTNAQVAARVKSFIFTVVDIITAKTFFGSWWRPFWAKGVSNSVLFLFELLSAALMVMGVAMVVVMLAVVVVLAVHE